jgi:hypothetical protein
MIDKDLFVKCVRFAYTCMAIGVAMMIPMMFLLLLTVYMYRVLFA